MKHFLSRVCHRYSRAFRRLSRNIRTPKHSRAPHEWHGRECDGAHRRAVRNRKQAPIPSDTGILVRNEPSHHGPESGVIPCPHLRRKSLLTRRDDRYPVRPCESDTLCHRWHGKDPEILVPGDRGYILHTPCGVHFCRMAMKALKRAWIVFCWDCIAILYIIILTPSVSGIYSFCHPERPIFQIHPTYEHPRSPSDPLFFCDPARESPERPEYRRRVLTPI